MPWGVDPRKRACMMCIDERLENMLKSEKISGGNKIKHTRLPRVPIQISLSPDLDGNMTSPERRRTGG